MSTREEIAELLHTGIAAARAGRVEEARQALMRVVDCDERNEQAWLWLSGVVESPEERRLCLENVLAINPGHAIAQAGLRHLQETAGQAAPLAPQPPPPSLQATPPPSQPAPPIAAPEPLPQVPTDGGEKCPHCGSPVPEFGTDCPSCGGALLVACPSCGEYAAVEQPACTRCSYALGNYTDGARYYLALAEAAVARNRRDAALHAAAYAETQARGDAAVLERVATLYSQLGQRERAVAACEQAVAAAPKNPALYARLGALHHAQGQLAAARDAMEQAAALSTDPAIRLELARLYLEADQTVAKAVGVLEHELKAHPRNPEIHILLGDAALKQNNRERAEHHYRDAARLTNADSDLGIEARTRLADILPSQAAEVWPERAAGGRSGGGERERPGCLAIYALWTGLNGALMILGGLAIVVLGTSFLSRYAQYADLPDISSLGQSAQIIVWIAAAVSFGFGLFYIILAWGLWALRNWARVVVLILQVLGLLGSLCQIIASVTGLRELTAADGLRQLPVAFLAAPAIGLAISLYVIFWFWANRDLFH